MIPRRPWWRRRALLPLLATSLLGPSCYQFALPRVETSTAAIDATCADTVHRVFTAAGFVPVSMTDEGPPMLFAPRTTGPLTFSMTLGWGVGVSFVPGGEPINCPFRLQAVSMEPDCMPRACIAPGAPIPPLSAGEDVTPQPPLSGMPADRACYGIAPTCPLSPVGGPQYTAALTELTRRLRDALAPKH